MDDGDEQKKEVPPPSLSGNKRKAPDTEPVVVSLDEIEGDSESEAELNEEDGEEVDDDDDGDEVGAEEESEESDSEFVDHRYDHITRRPGEIIRHAQREPEPEAPPVRTRSGRLVRAPVRFVASTRIDGCIDENDYDLEELKAIEQGFGDSDIEPDPEEPEEGPVAVLGGFVQADRKFIEMIRDDDYVPPAADEASSETTTASESEEEASTSEQDSEEEEEEDDDDDDDEDDDEYDDDD